MKFSKKVLFVVACVGPLGCAGPSDDGEAANTALTSSTPAVVPVDSGAASSMGAPTSAMSTSADGTTSATGTTAPGSTTPAAPTATVTGAPTGTTSAGPAMSTTGAAPTITATGEPTTDPVPTMSGAATSSGGSPEPTPTTSNTTEPPEPPDDTDVVDVGADEKFSFFVTSYHHIKLLSGRDEGFGGDLRWNGAATGLEGADALCQEMGRRVSFGHRTWRAYLSTSTVNAIDRVGDGPWYDFTGALVAEDVAGLLVPKTEGGGFGGMGGGMGGVGLGGGSCIEGDTDRPQGGALDCGTYDETGLLHNGLTDQDGDGVDDDDHDTMTATLLDGTYAGFSCDDWTSTTAEPPEAEEPAGEGPGGFGGLDTGIMMGHSWPAGSGQHWAESHAGHACAAGTNFVQDGFGDSSTVGGGGGYGGFYCFAVD